MLIPFPTLTTKKRSSVPLSNPSRKGIAMTATDDAFAIEWKDPAPSRRGFGSRPGVWIERLQPLLSHPGRWAVVYRGEGEKAAQKAAGMAAALRGEKTRKPDGKWDFSARQGEVFARYIGPE